MDHHQMYFDSVSIVPSQMGANQEEKQGSPTDDGSVYESDFDTIAGPVPSPVPRSVNARLSVSVHGDLEMVATRYQELMGIPFVVQVQERAQFATSIEGRRATQNPTPDQDPVTMLNKSRDVVVSEQQQQSQALHQQQEVHSNRQRRNATTSIPHPRDPAGARAAGQAFFPMYGHSLMVNRGIPTGLGHNEVFTPPAAMTAEQLRRHVDDLERHRRDLKIQKIRSGLREAKKQHYRIIKDSHEIKEKLQRLDEEAEVRTRHQLRSPFPPIIRPHSAIPVGHIPPQPSALQINQQPSFEELMQRRHSSAQQNRRDPALEHRSPFVPGAQNHVSFSLPANSQQVLYAVKQNYPTFLTMAKQILGDTKLHKEKVAESFLRALERRADLLEKNVKRLEGSVKHAIGERRQNLLKEIALTTRQYQQCVSRIEMLRIELEINNTQGQPGDGQAHQNRPMVTGSNLNQLRILQRVFEKQ